MGAAGADAPGVHPADSAAQPAPDGEGDDGAPEAEVAEGDPERVDRGGAHRGAPAGPAGRCGPYQSQRRTGCALVRMCLRAPERLQKSLSQKGQW